MADELHSRKDDELEQRDQRTFGRVVMMAGIAIAVIFVLALFAVRIAARHVRPVNPDKHPTSQLVILRTGTQDA